MDFEVAPTAAPAPPALAVFAFAGDATFETFVAFPFAVDVAVADDVAGEGVGAAGGCGCGGGGGVTSTGSGGGCGGCETEPATIPPALAVFAFAGDATFETFLAFPFTDAFVELAGVADAMDTLLGAAGAGVAGDGAEGKSTTKETRRVDFGGRSGTGAATTVAVAAAPFAEGEFAARLLFDAEPPVGRAGEVGRLATMWGAEPTE